MKKCKKEQIQKKLEALYSLVSIASKGSLVGFDRKTVRKKIIQNRILKNDKKYGINFL